MIVPTPVPPVTWETLPWSSSVADGSRRQALRHRGPYQAAVTPPVADLDISLVSALMADATDAALALTRFDAEFRHLAAPFASILLRSESASSSQIENLTSHAKAIGLAELGEKNAAPNAELIVANVRAMEAAIALADELSESAILTMQRALLERTNPDFVGRYRDQQVWIGGTPLGPHDAQFVPPSDARVPDAMTDLVHYANRTDVPPLVHVAIAHAQFETIHPFPDGNGRTGRALVHAMLRHAGVTENVTVPVSAGLLSDTRGYFDALSAYREGDATPIIRSFVNAAHAAIANGRMLVADIDQVSDAWKEASAGLRSDSSARRALPVVLAHPVVNVQLLSRELGVSSTAANTALTELVERGILEPASANRRNRVWIAPSILDALDAFAARAVRRW
ncbi:Fic family protein [Okibacterium endophyticum]